jgi:hypothetical protein
MGPRSLTAWQPPGGGERGGKASPGSSGMDGLLLPATCTAGAISGGRVRDESGEDDASSNKRTRDELVHNFF